MLNIKKIKPNLPVYSASAERAIEFVLNPSLLHIYLSLPKWACKSEAEVRHRKPNKDAFRSFRKKH